MAEADFDSNHRISLLRCKNERVLLVGRYSPDPPKDEITRIAYRRLRRGDHPARPLQRERNPLADVSSPRGGRDRRPSDPKP